LSRCGALRAGAVVARGVALTHEALELLAVLRLTKALHVIRELALGGFELAALFLDAGKLALAPSVEGGVARRAEGGEAPVARDRRTAEQSAAALRRAGITDLSIRPDFAISLGVFSTEEAARRFLAQVEAKGAKGVQVGPFSKEVKDSVYLVREPDTELVARLALLQREYATSTLRAVPCPAPEGAVAGAQAAKKPEGARK